MEKEFIEIFIVAFLIAGCVILPSNLKDAQASSSSTTSQTLAACTVSRDNNSSHYSQYAKRMPAITKPAIRMVKFLLRLSIRMV